MATNINLQPTLKNEKAILYPLGSDDFELLYAAAADPLVWEQHPNKDRWKREVFQTFFDGALQSGGAFKIADAQNGHIIGSTRFYDYNESDASIMIGYTFYARAYWGRGYNTLVKATMLRYIFDFVEKVYFQIGAQNIRSQIAIGRLGAVKIGEEELAYYGEPCRLNYVYEIKKEDWVEKGN